jgi:metallo-beta-lactamase family protein
VKYPFPWLPASPPLAASTAAHARLQQGRKPLAFDNLLTVNRHAEQEKMVNHLGHSARLVIVTAGRGMCTAAGRIVNYV